VAQFDAIIVGSGMSGGWVAKELCERGLKVLMLERSKDTKPERDYSDHLHPWEKDYFDEISPEEKRRNYFVQGDTYALKNSNKHLWMTDADQPYVNRSGRFKWRRGNRVGGKSLMWGRASYRLAPHDFEANKRDGEGVDWPVRYDDIAPWYDRVEKFVGIAGNRDGLDQLPDGPHYLPAYEYNCAETAFKTKLENLYPKRNLIMGRTANLKRVTEEQIALGRGQCQSRHLCHYGCSYGAYFSSVSATLPAAKKTGNLTLLSESIVTKVHYDHDTNRVTGVSVKNASDGLISKYTAKVVFLNSGAIATPMLLLNSANEYMPNGLANRSDQVGRNLMDHAGGVMIEARVPGLTDRHSFGRRPIGTYIPRYRNFPEQEEPYKRGWGYQVYSGRIRWGGWKQGVGQAFKDANRQPGDWVVILDAFIEILPQSENRVSLHKTKTDKWGQPIAEIDLRLGKNEQALQNAAYEDAIDIFTESGFTNIRDIQNPKNSSADTGGRNHEMGTARMGRNPKTSVLNAWNQSHDIPNLFITDGSFMTSSACQNPSLTYMAFSARAANHAADLLQGGQL
jgi:choline dehydrogenase-like flavoprotein